MPCGRFVFINQSLCVRERTFMQSPHITERVNNADQPSNISCLERLLLFACFLWIAGISIFSQAFFWTVEQLSLVSGFAWPDWAWVIVAIVQGLALLIPTALLAAFWPRGQLRQFSLAWSLGAMYVLLMAPMRLVQPPRVILANVVQIVLTGLSICLVVLLQRARGMRLVGPKAHSSLWLTLSFALWAAYPWLMWGALGSPLDTALNLTASLMFGLLAALILGWFLYQPRVAGDLTQAKAILTGGLAGFPLLIEMSSAFGFGGLQLLLLMVIPSFSIVATAIYKVPDPGKPGSRCIAVAALLGLVAAAPAMLIDPDELALVLALEARDLLQWALYAAFVSAIVGWVVGIILAGSWPRVRSLAGHPLLPIGTTISLVLAAILYFSVGQPGFHGDQLFIIFKDRAELASAAEIDNLDARRSYVYKTLVAQAKATQQEMTSLLDRFGIAYQSYYLVNGLSVNGGPLIQLWLGNRPEVDRVLQNPVLRPLRAPTPGALGGAEPPDETPWNIQFVGADRVWRDFGATGEGIVIGQSDSGADGQHPELAGSYRGRSDGDDFNWYDPWNNSSRPVDAGGHGTHTLATIVGTNTGIAPGASWMGCVNLARNLANLALYLDCLQFMLAPFPQGGDPFRDGDPSLAADVLNNSWGCPPVEGCDPTALLDAARALRQAGIFVVASAGNEGPFCETVNHPLALYDEVLSVGAVGEDGSLAFFSSVGPVTVDGSDRIKPDILAPGASVLSAFPDGTYERLDGTSMAGPHLAGVVALMWSANPVLRGDVDNTEQILLRTTSAYRSVPPACGDQAQPPYNGTGYGIVNAYSAVESALDWSE